MVKFEDKMKRLEEIVGLLENNNTDLDKSLLLYEEGLKLSKSLKNELKKFEDKIKEISDNEKL